MTPAETAARLRHSAGVLRALIEGVAPEQARWKPAPEAWSILEVSCHLLDEEREDFRARLELLVDDPDQSWPPIDPQAWARERGYLEHDLEQTLSAFEAERERSLKWLEGLATIDPERTYRHPGGPLRAGDLLAAWAGHDLIHARQLVRLHRQYLEAKARPFQLDYAGSW